DAGTRAGLRPLRDRRRRAAVGRAPGRIGLRQQAVELRLEIRERLGPLENGEHLHLRAPRLGAADQEAGGAGDAGLARLPHLPADLGVELAARETGVELRAVDADRLGVSRPGLEGLLAGEEAIVHLPVLPLRPRAGRRLRRLEGELVDALQRHVQEDAADLAGLDVFVFD